MTLAEDEYRGLLTKARRLVVAWRDADARVASPEDEAPIAWFDRFRDQAVEMYNSTRQYLADPNPDMLATRLDEIRGVSRGMNEGCAWERLAPQAEEPFGAYAQTVRSLWSRFPDNGTPEAETAAPILRTLAAEFEPVAPRSPTR